MLIRPGIVGHERIQIGALVSFAMVGRNASVATQLACTEYRDDPFAADFVDE
jgi:hypothetical protein